MNELVEFIRTRLSEDNGVAMAARSDAGEHWEPDNLNIDLADDADVDGACFATHAVARHVARQDPGRTLRAVAAKWAMLEDCLQLAATPQQPCELEAGFSLLTKESLPHTMIAERVLRRLASEWETHDDYRPEWRVS